MSKIETFAQWLESQMKKNDWNKAAVAGLLKISKGTVSAWVDDGVIPGAENLIALSELTGENPYYLIHLAYGLPLPENITGSAIGELRQKEKEILNRLHNVNEKGLDLLIDQIVHVLSPRFSRKKIANGRET